MRRSLITGGISDVSRGINRWLEVQDQKGACCTKAVLVSMTGPVRLLRRNLDIGLMPFIIDALTGDEVVQPCAFLLAILMISRSWPRGTLLCTALSLCRKRPCR